MVELLYNAEHLFSAYAAFRTERGGIARATD